MPGPWEKYQPGPWQKYSAPKQEPSEPLITETTAPAALQGLGQALTFGHLPQLQAGAAKLIGEPSLTPEQQEKLKGFPVQEPTVDRDYFIKRQEELAAKSPYAYGGGQLAGSLIQTPIAGAVAGKAIQGTGALARFGQSAASGAAQGLLTNPGDLPGQDTGLQVENRLGQAVTGGLLGVGGQAVGEAVGKVGKFVGNLPKKLTEGAEERAYASTGAFKKDLKQAIKLDPTGAEGNRARELGRYAMDNKIVQVGDDIGDIARKAASKVDEVGEKIGAVYEKASAKLSDPKVFKSLPDGAQQRIIESNFYKQKMADDFMSELRSSLRGTPGGKQAIAAAEKEVENFLEKEGTMLGIKEVQAYKSGLDDVLYKGSKVPQDIETQNSMKGIQEFRRFLKDKIQNRVDAIDEAFGTSGSKKSLGALNKEYGLAKTVHNTAKDRMASEMGNNFLSLTDKMAAITGAGVGVMSGLEEGDIAGALKKGAIGLGAGLVSKGARSYGRPIVTNVMRGAGAGLGAVQDVGGEALRQTGVSKILGATKGLINKPGAAGLIGAQQGIRPDYDKYK